MNMICMNMMEAKKEPLLLTAQDDMVMVICLFCINDI